MIIVIIIAMGRDFYKQLVAALFPRSPDPAFFVRSFTQYGFEIFTKVFDYFIKEIMSSAKIRCDIKIF
jgi:hypothetical protein